MYLRAWWWPCGTSATLQCENRLTFRLKRLHWHCGLAFIIVNGSRSLEIIESLDVSVRILLFNVRYTRVCCYIDDNMMQWECGKSPTPSVQHARARLVNPPYTWGFLTSSQMGRKGRLDVFSPSPIRPLSLSQPHSIQFAFHMSTWNYLL